MPTTASLFTDLVRTRHSPRQFLPAPLSPADIRGVLEDAQTAPSNSNTQPPRARQPEDRPWHKRGPGRRIRGLFRR
ncbi:MULTISPECIES: nitroreductase family protein [unclassified Streptomyces]|uniref:nitroreductase family protein n=1 Tax=unclassified Streptomyces TaxID=2593676 RepID=UPI003403F964